MKWRVVIDRALCRGNGVCMSEAPEVFVVIERSRDQGQASLLVDPPPADQRERVEAAVRQCPTGALKIVETP
jgi:ferredoxin